MLARTPAQSPTRTCSDEHAQVVAKHLAQQFIDLRRVRLRAQGIADLRLGHPERRFHNRAPVRVVQERLAVQVVVIRRRVRPL